MMRDDEPHAVATLCEAVRQRGLGGTYDDLGLIREHVCPPLLLFNYRTQALYEGSWTPIERVCRGLIIDSRNGRVVARPFPKFFNLGEVSETRLENLPSGPIEVTTKLDGSLIIVFWNPATESWQAATRGNFDGPQARWANEQLQHMDTSTWPRDHTLLFEALFPGSRVVISYADEHLVLIGARHTERGDDLTYAELQTMAAQCQVSLVQQHMVSTIGDLLPLVQIATGTEGWVVRFPGGLRAKLKTLEYLHLHRLVSDLTPKRVQERLVAGDHEIVAALPEEHQGLAKSWVAALQAAAAQEQQRVQTIFDEHRSLLREGRKAFAVRVNEQHPDEKHLLFALLDNKDIAPTIMARLDAEAICAASAAGDIEA